MPWWRPSLPLTGDIEQVPSAVSAIKVKGERAYHRVRSGEASSWPPGRSPCRGSSSATPRAADADGTPVLDVDVEVTVSSGTYVRALARDLGAALGCGGHLTALRRTRVGGFAIADAHPLADLEARQGERMPVTPLADAARAAFAVREVDEAQARTLGYGQRLESAVPGRTEPVAAIAPGRHPGGDARRVASHGAQPRRVCPGEFVEWCPCIAGPTPPETPAALRPCVLTLGNFDGVHRGHRAVLNALVDAGHRLGLPAVAITFEPHPIAVLRPEQAPELIAPGAIRDDLIADSGVDGLLVLDFTTEFAQQTPEDFVRAVFVRGLDARCVVVGMDTRFGYRNSGDVSTLADLGEQFGFEVVALDDVGEGERFSSTVVRDHLRAGEVGEAARILGRPHRVVGTVVHGNHRGKALGYPTANLSADSLGLVPLEGVYAGWLTRLDLADGRARPHDAGRDQRRHQPHLRDPRPAHRRGLRARPRRPRPLRRAHHGRVHGPHPADAEVRERRRAARGDGQGRRAVPRAAHQDRPRLIRMHASGSGRGPAGLSP